MQVHSGAIHVQHHDGRCWSPFSGVRLRVRSGDPGLNWTAFEVDQSSGSEANPHRFEQALESRSHPHSGPQRESEDERPPRSAPGGEASGAGQSSRPHSTTRNQSIRALETHLLHAQRAEGVRQSGAGVSQTTQNTWASTWTGEQLVETAKVLDETKATHCEDVLTHSQAATPGSERSSKSKAIRLGERVQNRDQDKDQDRVQNRVQHKDQDRVHNERLPADYASRTRVGHTETPFHSARGTARE